MVWDVITIYREISCDITPDHLETSGKYIFNEKPQPRCGLLSFFFGFVSDLILACPRSGIFVVFLLSISWTHHRTDSTPCKQQNLVPSRLRLLPVCFLFHFILFYFIFLSSLFLLDTWYLVLCTSYEVPYIYSC